MHHSEMAIGRRYDLIENIRLESYFEFHLRVVFQASGHVPCSKAGLLFPGARLHAMHSCPECKGFIEFLSTCHSQFRQVH